QVIGVIGPSPAVFQGTVGPADSSDFYRFTLDDWTQLTVTLGGLTADADITLLDENGQYLGDSVAAGTESELIEYVAGPGTYFIEIYMYQGETPYEMTIIGAPAEPPPDDTVGNAPEEAHSFGDILEAPVSFDEWVGSGDPADYYSFSVSDRATVTVSMDGLASDADISLEDDFGSVLASSAEGGTNPEYMQSELEPGTYYLAVVPFSGNTSYHLEVTAEPAGPAPEDLAGNTVATARAVTLTPGTPAEFRDWVGGADTSDYYTFTVEAAGTFQLALDGLTSDADVELLAEDGTSVLASSLLAGTDPEAITHQLQAGTYYVRVYVFSGSTDYRLEMTVQ
ncbi:MAG: PPC domain-containing protein, partial [Rhodospirillaceae bacterium]|nr:PPC domain-containing protein [Rhodospirillaceae bacterium]